MARYFFNLYDGENFTDDVGSEHPDIASVRQEAVEFITERLHGKLLSQKEVTAWILNVTNEDGRTVLILSVSGTVQFIDAA